MAAERPYTLICRRCQRVPELVGKEGHQEVHCAQCGVRGEAEEVHLAAVSYFKQSFIHSKKRDFQRNMSAGLKGVKNVVYTPGEIRTPTVPILSFVTTGGDWFMRTRLSQRESTFIS